LELMSSDEFIMSKEQQKVLPSNILYSIMWGSEDSDISDLVRPLKVLPSGLKGTYEKIAFLRRYSVQDIRTA